MAGAERQPITRSWESRKNPWWRWGEGLWIKSAEAERKYKFALIFRTYTLLLCFLRLFIQAKLKDQQCEIT